MISMILATGRDYSIGKSNQLLWHIPEDLQYFKEHTEGGIVVMGNNTSKSLPFKSGGLPNRENVVLTTGKPSMHVFPKSNTTVQYVNDIEEVKTKLLGIKHKPVWICGGAAIFEAMKDIVDEVHLTKVDQDFPEADTHFNMDWVRNALQWEKISYKELTDDVSVSVYKRIKQ